VVLRLNPQYYGELGVVLRLNPQYYGELGVVLRLNPQYYGGRCGRSCAGCRCRLRLAVGVEFKW
jgi:hypothetical protein